MRRSVDLLQLAWAGEGRYSEGPGGPLERDDSVSLQPLPWPAPEYARITLRRFGDRAQEATLSLYLPAAARWCTPPLDLPADSRLRLEALAVGREALLRIAWQAEVGGGWQTAARASRPDTAVPATLDLALPRGHGSLCLQAEAGPVSLGEPRIVSPEPDGSDARPRFVVLTICDALRGDRLTDPRAERTAPAMHALSRRGHRYLRAVSPGAHSQAAVLPLLTGRDLARVDPVRARRFTPMGTPLEYVYGRGNLAISHLAQACGYHTVFLGNNSFLVGTPLFARLSNRGRPDTGTLDTIAALPATLSRYADERVLLVYYVSAPHGNSATPRRLFERLGCGSLAGLAEERCAYDARVAHADEAVDALQQALHHYGLAPHTLQVLTADHGEVLGDGRQLEAEIFRRWYPLDVGHGGATHGKELHVPLLVIGPGLAPATWSEPVSTLDIVPTLARLLQLPPPSRLDGRVLPLMGGSRTPRAITSQGYCSDSVLEDARQLVWWQADCARRRERDGWAAHTQMAELWQDGVLQATDVSDSERLAPLVRRHLEWLAARLPAQAWLIDGAGLGAGTLSVVAEAGRIADWGPSSGPAQLGAYAAAIDATGRTLRIAFRGDDPGLIFVSTWPSDAPVRFELADHAGPPPVTFVGPLQLPLAALGRRLDPLRRPELWRAAAAPARQPSHGPHLRLWRQPYRAEAARDAGRAASELDRVLREWGYIR